MIEKLISIAGVPLSGNAPDLKLDLFKGTGKLGLELQKLLKLKNGFFAFESALRVFPMNTSDLSIGLSDWNSPDLWRQEFDLLGADWLFFAEDIFGIQFCINDNHISAFDPETGIQRQMASSMEEWAEIILGDYNYWTGYSIAHEWQTTNGGLPGTDRLIPKTPFVCGGEFKLDNLFAIEAVEGMKYRAQLAKQIKDLPDGATVKFKLVD